MYYNAELDFNEFKRRPKLSLSRIPPTIHIYQYQTPSPVIDCLTQLIF